MSWKTLLTALAAVMMACTAFVVQGTQFSNDSCIEEDQDGDSIYCKVAVGPASFTHKSVVGVGVAACQDDDDPATPLPCDPETGTILPSAGGAIFLNDFAEAPTHDILFELWVGDLNVVCPPGPLVVLCGFDVLFCNDRDLSTICTNVNDDSDQLRRTESNEPLLGEDCNDKDKDEKRCGVDDLDAYVNACFMPLESKNGPDGHWAPGQLVAFIGNWVSSWPGGAGFPVNIGAGISAGFYEVWLREGPGCIVSACDDRADNDGDGNVDYPGDRQCLDEDDTSEEGICRINILGDACPEPPGCSATRNVIPDPLNLAGAPLVDNLQAKCIEKNGNITNCTIVGAEGANLRYATCLRPKTCKMGELIRVTADLINGRTSVYASLWCDLSQRAFAFDSVNAADIPPNQGADDADGTKLTGDYDCRMYFDWNHMTVYKGKALCRERFPGDPPPRDP